MLMATPCVFNIRSAVLQVIAEAGAFADEHVCGLGGYVQWPNGSCRRFSVHLDAYETSTETSLQPHICALEMLAQLVYFGRRPLSSVKAPACTAQLNGRSSASGKRLPAQEHLEQYSFLFLSAGEAISRNSPLNFVVATFLRMSREPIAVIMGQHPRRVPARSEQGRQVGEDVVFIDLTSLVTCCLWSPASAGARRRTSSTQCFAERIVSYEAE
ncbi:hypothetical protein AK812_SmicGene19050 [Symbiodinium microadriaticum]|uniref:Uncharacterized protein n=1 Tax=Symbiodinium microadriaticum TaxID=2951 RepID=A0A1Q9DTJ9_SYMMI|nr:hypothetical protein AK812_SmicGene19050 [Symbiodinium microadriaticum]